MRRGDPRAAVVGIAGGVALAALAILAAGAGHGTYVPLAIFGAPFSVINVVAGALGALLMWPAIGVLASLSAQTPRRVARWALLAHYVAAAVIASGVTGSPLVGSGAEDRLGLLPTGVLV